MSKPLYQWWRRYFCDGEDVLFYRARRNCLPEVWNCERRAWVYAELSMEDMERPHYERITYAMMPKSIQVVAYV